MAIQNWRLSQLAIVAAASLCAEFWAIRAMLRMEKLHPLLAGVNDDLPCDNPFRDLVPPMKASLFWEHFTLEALVFAIIPGIVLFVAWQWGAKKQVTPDT